MSHVEHGVPCLATGWAGLSVCGIVPMLTRNIDRGSFVEPTSCSDRGLIVARQARSAVDSRTTSRRHPASNRVRQYPRASSSGEGGRAFVDTRVVAGSGAAAPSPNYRLAGAIAATKPRQLVKLSRLYIKGGEEKESGRIRWAAETS